MPGWALALAGVGGLAALTGGALLAFSYVRARMLLTPYRSPVEHSPAEGGLPFENVRIPNPRGELAGWLIPSTNGCTLICCHGIGANRSQWLAQVARLRERSGYGALLFDFAGHGESEGHLVTYGAQEAGDVASVVRFLRARADTRDQRLGVMGYSLGAITAALAAAQTPELEAVALESCFADLQDDLSRVFTRFTHLPSFPFAQLVVFWGQLISGSKLAEIRPAQVIGRLSPRAVYLISDLQDEIATEPHDGETLYANAGEPKRLWQLPGARHVEAFPLYPDEWIQRVGDFFDEYLLRRPATPARDDGGVATLS